MAVLKRESSPSSLISRFRSGNGCYKWLRWTLSSDVEKDGIWALASSMNDAKLVEDEDEARTDQILQSIVSACPHAIISVDAERKVRIWNPAAEKMFGLTESEVVGGRVPFVTDASRRDSDEFNKRALTGESFTNFEVQRTRR